MRVGWRSVLCLYSLVAWILLCALSGRAYGIKGALTYVAFIDLHFLVLRLTWRCSFTFHHWLPWKKNWLVSTCPLPLSPSLSLHAHLCTRDLSSQQSWQHLKMRLTRLYFVFNHFMAYQQSHELHVYHNTQWDLFIKYKPMIQGTCTKIHMKDKASRCEFNEHIMRQEFEMAWSRQKSPRLHFKTRKQSDLHESSTSKDLTANNCQKSVSTENDVLSQSQRFYHTSMQVLV